MSESLLNAQRRSEENRGKTNALNSHGGKCFSPRLQPTEAGVAKDATASVRNLVLSRGNREMPDFTSVCPLVFC